MRFFKESIDFTQFIADLISFQFDFLARDFNKLIAWADEFKVLSAKDKEDCLEKAYSLVIADITIQSAIRFQRYLTNEETGEAVSIIYAKYLTEYRKIPKTLALGRVEEVIRLLESFEKAEEDFMKRDEHYREIEVKSFPKIHNRADKARLYLCSAFADYFADRYMNSESWQGRHFAAFKLAKGFTKADIVGAGLKRYKVTF